MADHDGNHRCLIEKNVPIAFILPNRWQDGAESLGIETTSCFELLPTRVIFERSWATFRSNICIGSITKYQSEYLQ